MIISNTTSGIYPLHDYQQKLFQQLSRGFRAGEMAIISAGRQTGKSSMYMKMLKNRMYGHSGTTVVDYEYINSALFGDSVKSKYKFSRAKWHEVSLMYKSFDPIRERLEWCEQNFGPQPKNPDAWTRWYAAHGTLRFSDSKDYEWFMLRFS